MKLIIDIDEDYYNIVQKNGGSNYVEDAVLNGIPLDDIKAEIQRLKPNNLRPEQMTDYDYAMAEVFYDILSIIDKHIGKEKE